MRECRYTLMSLHMHMYVCMYVCMYVYVHTSEHDNCPQYRLDYVGIDMSIFLVEFRCSSETKHLQLSLQAPNILKPAAIET